MSLSLTFPGYYDIKVPCGCSSHHPACTHLSLPWAQGGGCRNTETTKPGTAWQGLLGWKKKETKVSWKSEIRIGNGRFYREILRHWVGFSLHKQWYTAKWAGMQGWWQPSREPMEMCSAVPVTCWCVLHPGADSSSCCFGASPSLSGEQDQHETRSHTAVILGAGEQCLH